MVVAAAVAGDPADLPTSTWPSMRKQPPTPLTMNDQLAAAEESPHRLFAAAAQTIAAANPPTARPVLTQDLLPYPSAPSPVPPTVNSAGLPTAEIDAFTTFLPAALPPAFYLTRQVLRSGSDLTPEMPPPRSRRVHAGSTGSALSDPGSASAVLPFIWTPSALLSCACVRTPVAEETPKMKTPGSITWAPGTHAPQPHVHHAHAHVHIPARSHPHRCPRPYLFSIDHPGPCVTPTPVGSGTHSPQPSRERMHKQARALADAEIARME